MNSQNEDDGQSMFKFKKEVTLGNLISAVVLITGLCGAYLTQDRRITVVETAFAAHIVADDKQDKITESFRSEVADQLNRIEKALDRNHR